MSVSRNDLLRPSLSHSAIAEAPYSLQATFLTAFLGGPFAALLITAVNSVRLQRWLRDLMPLSLALAAYIGFDLALDYTEWGAVLRASATELAGPRGLSYLHRLIALGMFALGFALHRKEQRSADLMGLERPNGWKGGIACVVLGTVAQISLFALLPGAHTP